MQSVSCFPDFNQTVRKSINITENLK